MKNERKFRRALRRAALINLLFGKITTKDFGKIRRILVNPIVNTPDGDVNVLDKFAETGVQVLKSEQLIGANTNIESIDWDAVLEVLAKILPKILAILSFLLMFI